MEKSITIAYDYRNTAIDVQLSYAIEMIDNMQTIKCAVTGPPFYDWLHLRKFALHSLYESKMYTPIFNEANNARNMDTSLFIDQAYINIMHAEKMKIKTVIEVA